MSGFYDDFIEGGEEGFASEMMSEAEIEKIVQETLGDVAESLVTIAEEALDETLTEMSEELDGVDPTGAGC